jgi:hypothetical protein
MKVVAVSIEQRPRLLNSSRHRFVRNLSIGPFLKGWSL